ncbi:hypothetical protein E2562_017325 [Oryza meyeriana var. granulata]|uniref:Uncharacterized protein n=1 Tax=Oryza meyeriana var. granulata TaxID=110450 RepID=A0A6G1BXI1_9ORYZ|nr:hypothetical protein E2562_017325 [Oryza meyeriana var. granulata]
MARGGSVVWASREQTRRGRSIYSRREAAPPATRSAFCVSSRSPRASYAAAAAGSGRRTVV